MYGDALQILQKETKFITKCYMYCKVWQEVITKCDITPDLAVVVNNSQLWIVMLRQS